MKSKIEELTRQLKLDGKLTELSTEECEAIRQRIDAQVIPFRYELARKQTQSEVDTAKIILNA